MAKKIFASCFIAVTGDFGKERSHDRIKRWIEFQGGRFASKVEDGVTHLVCSKEHYKSHVQAVRKANELKNCHIVTYDWLEDCIQNKRKLSPKNQYSCKTSFKQSAAKKAERKKRERRQLKKDGPAPDSAAGIAYSFFDKHLHNLNAKSTPRKPDVEEYNLFDKMYKRQQTGADDLDDGNGKADAGQMQVMEFGSTPTEKLVNKSSDKSPSTAPAPVSGSATETPSPSPPPQTMSDFASSPPSSKSVSFDQAATPVETSMAKSDALQELSGKPTSISKTPTTLAQLASAIATKPKHGSPSAKAMGKRRAASPSSVPLPSLVRPVNLRDYTDPPSDLDYHHIYRDHWGFVYNITLVRIMLAQNTNERFVMRLYESNVTPCTYAVHLRFYASRKMTANVDAMNELARRGLVVAAVGSDWSTAFEKFRHIFEEKTGLTWENRLGKVPVGSVMPDGARFFAYMKPKEGEPTGIMAPTQGSKARATALAGGSGSSDKLSG